MPDGGQVPVGFAADEQVRAGSVDLFGQVFDGEAFSS
jgi:hypothetical protein